MKAIIIIAAVAFSAVLLKVVDIFTNRRKINSVGAKSNAESKKITKVNINDPEELKSALEYYKDFAD